MPGKIYCKYLNFLTLKNDFPNVRISIWVFGNLEVIQKVKNEPLTTISGTLIPV
jgi:hypothetical protein